MWLRKIVLGPLQTRLKNATVFFFSPLIPLPCYVITGIYERVDDNPNTAQNISLTRLLNSLGAFSIFHTATYKDDAKLFCQDIKRIYFPLAYNELFLNSQSPLCFQPLLIPSIQFTCCPFGFTTSVIMLCQTSPKLGG